MPDASGQERRPCQIAPNAGCVLADAKSMSHLIDRYTNWAAWLPTPGTVDVFEGLLW
jgi:hypothetical protein